MLELRGVYAQDSKVDVEEIYLKLAKSGSGYELSVVNADGSGYTCGILLSLQPEDNGKLGIYRHSCVNGKLGEIFNLDSSNCLVRK